MEKYYHFFLMELLNQRTVRGRFLNGRINMNNDLIITGRVRDLGGFSVVRMIPSAKRRHVGPFVFLDHLGPMTIDHSHILDVRPHPHIGLATVTYLFEGRVRHRDSLGSDQVIVPGDLNWMTAGKGVVHSERTPEEDRDSKAGNKIHGIQIWVGLPLEQEECEPYFVHYSKSVLPNLDMSEKLSGKLLIGNYQGISSPVTPLSPTVFIDLYSKNKGEEVISFKEEEIGIFLIAGHCRINDQDLNINDLMVVSDPSTIKMNYTEETRLIIIGGEPFSEPRYIWWNFISSSKERIQKAASDWQNQTMGNVSGESDFIPLPDTPLR